MLRTRRERRERESALVATRVEHSRSDCHRTRQCAIVALIEEVAGLLSVLEIDVDSNSVFRRERFRNRLAGENPDAIVEALLLSHRAMTAFDDRARMEQFGERLDQSLAHPIRSGGEQLHDEHVAESIDDHA